MGYPRNLTQRQREIIAPVVVKLENISEGKMVIVQDTAEALEEVRYLVYAWLHENNIKSLFKITKPMPDKLVIYRKSIPRPKIETGTEDPRVMRFVTSTLINIEDEDEAIKLIKKRFEEPLAQADCLEEWRRIMGRK